MSNTNDLIRRGDAINAILGITAMRNTIPLDSAIFNIKKLPSAQPEKRTDKRTETHACDLIDRQAAIDAVDATWWNARGIRKAIQELPSAQPEPIRINLNEPIKVKLTDWGKEIYYHQYDRTNHIAGRKICEPKFPKEDENGYTEFQLWCFMELYGEHMGMTLPNVIKPLEIVYGR